MAATYASTVSLIVAVETLPPADTYRTLIVNLSLCLPASADITPGLSRAVNVYTPRPRTRRELPLKLAPAIEIAPRAGTLTRTRTRSPVNRRSSTATRADLLFLDLEPAEDPLTLPGPKNVTLAIVGTGGIGDCGGLQFSPWHDAGGADGGKPPPTRAS